MNEDENLRRRAQQEQIQVPEEFSRRVRRSLEQLPSGRNKRGGWRRVAGVAAAAVLAVAIILPNSSAAMAQAMADIPLVGPLFQVITVRTYWDKSGNNHVTIENPQILEDGDSQGAQEINQQVEQYTQRLVDEYEQAAKADGYFNLDVTWEVVTNTENWFTLRINSDLIMASGNHQEQHYHIDVASGEQKTLSDLFPEDYDYVQVISDEIKSQMRQRMEQDEREVYWLEGVSQLGTYFFDTIDPEQDFYFDDQGRIVIPFDKYEVGPGSTGSPEFTLAAQELYENLLCHP